MKFFKFQAPLLAEGDRLICACEITLLLIDMPNQTVVHLSSLSPLQQQILA